MVQSRGRARVLVARIAVVVSLLALSAGRSTAAPASNAEPAPVPTERARGAATTSNDKQTFSSLGLRMKEEILQMSEFFDTTLPGTLKKYKLVLSVSPRASDLRRREFVRYPIRVRYGLRERWELEGGVAPFSPNPFNDGVNHRWGMGEGWLGIRHDVGSLEPVFEHVTVGFRTRAPLGRPPLQIIDYHTHLNPYVNTSHALPWEYTTLFTNLSYDRMVETPFRAPPPPHAYTRHTAAITNSVLYKPGEFGASVEYGFRHFQDWDGIRLGHEFKAGVIWDPPLWRTSLWNLPGKWQVELSYRVTLEEGRSVDHGESIRVRWRTTVRDVWDTLRGRQ